jgi:hypothetical protein
MLHGSSGCNEKEEESLLCDEGKAADYFIKAARGRKNNV